MAGSPEQHPSPDATTLAGDEGRFDVSSPTQDEAGVKSKDHRQQNQQASPYHTVRQMPTPAKPDPSHLSHPDHPKHAAWQDDPDAFAEHEYGMYGGDDPHDPPPKIQRQGTGGQSVSRQGSGGHRVRRQRTLPIMRPTERLMQQHSRYQPTNTEPFPDLYLTDTAFSDSHRIRSRTSQTSRRRTSSPTLAEETPANSTEEDPNKVTWNENDPDNPQMWSIRKKWFLTLLGGLLTVNVTFASSAPSSATMVIAQEFGVSTEVGALITSLFLCGYILGPILWAPSSELLGRRLIFLISMGCYTIFQIGCALAQNIQTILICRFITGTFAASPLTNAGGLIADMWDPIGRGKAMSVFTASVFVGPVLGPVVASFVTVSYLGWRWIFWLIMIWGGATWIACLLFLPETFSPVLLAKRAKQLRKQEPEKNAQLYAEHERADFSLKGIATRTLGRPFVMLFSEPVLAACTLYLSVVYGILYGTFSAFPIIFQKTRGLTTGQGGLCFIGVGIGSVSGALLNIKLQSHYRYLVPKWHGHPPCEERLPGGILAGPLLVIGLFWLGWTGAYPSVPWYVPELATILLGMSFTLCFISYLSYLIDTFLMYSASALAANTIVRSAVGAAFPLFTTQMYTNLGIQWACTLLACISLLLAPIPLIFYVYGHHLRNSSRFAPALDLRIAPLVEKEEHEASNDDAARDAAHHGAFEHWKRSHNVDRHYHNHRHHPYGDHRPGEGDEGAAEKGMVKSRRSGDNGKDTERTTNSGR